MKRITNKIFAILLVIVLLGAQFVPTGVYAAGFFEQNNNTNQKNVKFNATIGDDNSHDQYSYTANIDSDANKLYISTSVENVGYLKDIVIRFENNNYLLKADGIDDQRIKSISQDRIELNMISAGQTVDLAIPIILDKPENISKENFNKESKVILEATYVNEDNKEKKVEKELTQNLSWTVDENSLTTETSQRVIRYLTYNNQTMLSVILSDKLKDAKMPIDSKELIVSVPELSGNKPSKIIINAIDTANTNGVKDGTAFSNDNWIYDENTGNITITINNPENEEGIIAWNKDLADQFVITYLYDVNINEEATTVSSKVTTKTTLVNGMNVTNETQENDYNIDGKIGDIVNVEVNSNVETLNKGYMYNNININEGKKETEFSEDYKINMGLVEALDKVTVKDLGELFNEKEIDNAVYTKKISISQEELIKVLGESGSINVLKEDGTLIGTLNKDTLQLDVNSPKITLEISKPIAEGDITIYADKAISSELNLSKEELQSLTNMTSRILVNKEVTKTITLEEPTSKASIEISNQNLSTVVENEDVVVTATLETDDITDALYENPDITIKLPDEVTNMELKDATLLYEDQLVQNEFTVEGNTIHLSLDGLQTKYATQSISKGTVVRLVLDLTLDNLAASRDANVTLSYVNNNTAVQNQEARTNSVETPVKVVAPSGFVTINSLTGYNGNEEVSSQEGNEETGRIAANSLEKTMKVKGTIVNNLGKDATGVKILGRIPFSKNKNVGTNEDLGSNFDTKLASELTLDGITGTTYYSTNGDADSDLQNANNGWTENYTEDAKSYLIVLNEAMANATKGNFNYDVTIPANLQYNNTVKSNFGVYYNNDAEDGTTQNLVAATPVGITTGLEPDVTAEVTAYDFNTGAKIENGADIKEGQYIKFKVKVKNNADVPATNIKVTQIMPEELAALVYREGSFGEPGNFVLDDELTEQVQIVERLNAGEEKEVEFNVGNTEIIDENEETEDQYQIVASFKVVSDQTPEQILEYSFHNTKGTLALSLTADTKGKVLTGDEITFYLTLRNVNRDEKNNVVLNLKFPQGMEYSGTEYQEYYNRETNTLSYPVGQLTSRKTLYLQFYGNVTGELPSDATVVASATCDGGQEEFSNSIAYSSSKIDIFAEQSTNIPEGVVLDTDQLEFYIDIENRGNTDVTLTLRDAIPTELKLQNYVLVVNGEEVASATAGIIRTNFELKVGQNARATIRVKPNTLPQGQEATAENRPTLQIVDGRDISINSVSIKIQGTGNYTQTGSDEPLAEGTYRITGNVWMDENNDGRKSSEESKLSNIRVMLYDSVNGAIAKDISGNDLVTTTGEDGRYTFNNVKPGQYNVVAEFDTNVYNVTVYRADGISESENSDFVNATLDGQEVAATDNFTITNSNLYNLDLGLSRIRNFDLSINKTVSRVTVTNPNLETRVQDVNAAFGKIDLYNTYIKDTTVLVEYSIVVTNEGEIPGYAKEIVDYLPDGMAFSSELNSNWYLASDGNLYSSSLANTVIQPGESKTITLVLTRKMTGENTGTVHNQVEISQSYNEYGLEDRDSTAKNKQDGEDDISYADLLIAMGTGKEVASFIGITIGIFAIIGVAVWIIKKKVLNKI